MKFALKPIALAMLLAATQLSGVAYAQASKAPGAPASQPAGTATKAPISTSAPQDWVIYDDTTYTPVVDDLSRHLDAARKAFDAKDRKKAATELRAAADELKREAGRAIREEMPLVNQDKALLAQDTKFARDTARRMHASALKVRSAASAVESGRIKTKADLDKAIDKAARADMERRWLVTDVTRWYPVTEEPQQHFTAAVAAYARKDYRAAAAEIRKAQSYLRLEAGRASGKVGQELDGSVAQLGKVATSVEKGALKDEQSMAKAFAKAEHALALEHRSKAAESWLRKEYDKAGYDLKAAAHGLESAAGWVGGEAKAGAAATGADVRALGDKLALGVAWTRDEVAKGFESLGSGINALGEKIAGTQKAAPFHVGA